MSTQIISIKRPATSGRALNFRLILMLLFTFCATVSQGNPLVGAYTINAALPTAGTNFQTFSDFASSLTTNGISGNVVTTVVPGSGPYLEQVLFSDIAGTGPSSTITLEGNGETISAATNSTYPYVIRLDSCQYFTINYLLIKRDSTSSPAFCGIHLADAGSHITIMNCYFDLGVSFGGNNVAFAASGIDNTPFSAGKFQDVLFNGNNTNGGGYGAVIYGMVNNFQATGIQVKNNYFYNANIGGLVIVAADSAEIAYNYFEKSLNIPEYSYAVDIGPNCYNAKIFNNTIKVSQTDNGNLGVLGIRISAGSNHKVFNNVIQGIMLTNGVFIGIDNLNANASQIFFNTIVLDNPVTINGTLFGIREMATTSAAIKNNIISISQAATTLKSALDFDPLSISMGTLNSDHNDLWVPGGHLVTTGTIQHDTLPAWQLASGQDSNSLSLDPHFVSSLFPQPTDGILDNSGTPIAGITEDFAGIVRTNPPDMGAYEFTGTLPPAPAGILGDTAVCEGYSGLIYTVLAVPGAASYFWTVTGASLSGGQGTDSITVTAATTPFTVSVYAVNNAGISDTVFIAASIKPLPIVNLALLPYAICWCWPPYQLVGGTPAGGTYSGTGVVNNIFTPMWGLIGDHPLIYTFLAGNGCSAYATDTLLVDACIPCWVGITEDTGNLISINVYPNPGKTHWTIATTGLANGYKLRLFNLTGKLMLDYAPEEPSFNLPCKDLPKGLYFLQIISNSGEIYTRKLEL